MRILVLGASGLSLFGLLALLAWFAALVPQRPSPRTEAATRTMASSGAPTVTTPPVVATPQPATTDTAIGIDAWCGTPARNMLPPTTPATVTDRVFYAGALGREVLKATHVLSDGTVLIGGSAQDLDWVPANVPRTTLDGSAIRNAQGTGRIAFLLHASVDLSTLLRVVRLPAGAAEDISFVRATNVPGQVTGALVVSGTTRDSKANGGGYFIARLNGNFVDAAPTAFAWVKNVWATGDHQVFQPWDVDGQGRVVYASGQPYGDDWAALYRLKADGTPDVVEHWRYHVATLKAGGARVEGHWTPASSRTDVDLEGSQIVFKTTNRCDLRSWTAADYDAVIEDENGTTKQGQWPMDLFFDGPCNPNAGSTTQSGPGYTGYAMGAHPTQRIGGVALDRRTGAMFVGFSIQSRLPDGNPDFEPAVIAFDADGRKRWWARLYRESTSRSTPDQYVDALAIDYSKPADAGSVVVLARSHGNNTINLWPGNAIPASRNPDNPGFAFQNGFTGTNGNIHLSWVGKLRLGDGRLMHASWLAAYQASHDLTQAPYSDPILDGWPSHNAGWPQLNTTRCRPDVRTDLAGRVYVLCTGQRSVTTRNAFQKMPKSSSQPTPSWPDFVRVFDPTLKTLAYGSILSGQWDSSGAGGGNIALTGVAPFDGGVLVVGHHRADANNAVQGNALPAVGVPAWGTGAPAGESAVVARLEF
ncbi:hypothetical protein SD81_041025 [Tolypothrix campylonemoides VB511288]|nr:hypothetical protein SD81_041025 [Tolypothrix campylonemoides VB511288]